MRTLKIILLILGIILEVCAFCFSQIEYMPWISYIISPTYSQGMQGIKRLEGGNNLSPQDIGFAVISNVIRNSNPSKFPNQAEIIKMKPVPRPELRGASETAFPPKEVRIIFGEDKVLIETTGTLRTELAKAYFNKPLFVCVCVIFGLVLLLPFLSSVCKGKNK